MRAELLFCLNTSLITPLSPPCCSFANAVSIYQLLQRKVAFAMVLSGRANSRRVGRTHTRALLLSAPLPSPYPSAQIASGSVTPAQAV